MLPVVRPRGSDTPAHRHGQTILFYLTRGGVRL